MSAKEEHVLSWRFSFRESMDQESIDKFLEQFVFSFVEKNNWSCGGGVDYMSMYAVNGKTSKSRLQKALLEYLRNYKDLLSSITILVFEESTDTFKDVELIEFHKATQY